MQSDYDVQPLEADDVLRAFAVMRAAMPWLALEQWRELTATDAQRHAWLAAIDSEGYIHGLCHVVARSASPVAVHLEVPVFAPVSLFDEKGVSSAMLEAVRQRALIENCDKIHIWAAAPTDWKSLVELPRRLPGEGDLLIAASDSMRNLH